MVDKFEELCKGNFEIWEDTRSCEKWLDAVIYVTKHDECPLYRNINNHGLKETKKSSPRFPNSGIASSLYNLVLILILKITIFFLK